MNIRLLLDKIILHRYVLLENLDSIASATVNKGKVTLVYTFYKLKLWIKI
jgi:hypothetical protein